MPAKKTVKSRARKPSNKSKALKIVNSSWFRPVVILLAIAIGVSVFLIMDRSNPHERSAKDTADAALKAFVECDAVSLKKYYVLISEEKLSNFKKECKPGGSYLYSRDLAKASGTSSLNNASYEYRINLPGSYEGRIMVYLLYPDAEIGWTVFSFTPLDFTSKNIHGF